MSRTETVVPVTSPEHGPVRANSDAAPELPYIEDPLHVAPRDARELSKVFLDRLAVVQEGTAEHQYVRNTLIEMNLSLVRYIAARFRRRADQMDDIVQVGTIGLIKAIDRFDLARQVGFATFAVPHITGEIKRHFRNTGWAVHVPRRLQELRVDIAKSTDELSQRLDRAPTTAELAEHLGMSREEIEEGIVAANGFTATSLDAPSDDSPGEAGEGVADRIGDVDQALETVEDMEALRPLVARLGERERLILRLRFGEELSQAQIGAELGISQMQVSRLLARTLSRLRAQMLPRS
ncbi:RNA polymerase sigma factor SigF [Streptomyces sp. NPDC048639]|uniref:RNA polymerase sigma factor SigF n=1 Tax=Streptomyces sp. NPDC048639 TaxID=3365581 RepID=UPI003715C79A